LGESGAAAETYLMRATRSIGLAAACILGLLTSEAGAVECLTSSGRTACGFHCISAESQVRCAQTPDGVCSTSSGVVACWDPPAMLRRALESVPRPSCVTNGGQTACGYHCVVAYDQAQCAQTPYGACAGNGGRLVCWDPPADLVLARRDATPTATCLLANDRVACGYHCLAFQGTLRCAQTPDGVCRREGGAVECWDPPIDAPAVAYDPAAERACLAGSEGRVCGFRCLATARSTGCGDARRDVCRVDGESRRVVCASPY